MKHVKMLFILLGVCSSYIVSANDYYVKLTRNGIEHEFMCHSNQSIFEAAKEYGIEFDYSYDAGATDISLAKLNYGVVDLSRQSYLDKKQIEKNFILLTEAYPKSDCEITIFSNTGNSTLKSFLFSGSYVSYFVTPSSTLAEVNLYEDDLIGYRIKAYYGPCDITIFHETNDVEPRVLSAYVRTFGVAYKVAKSQLGMFKEDRIQVVFFPSNLCEVDVYS